MTLPLLSSTDKDLSIPAVAPRAFPYIKASSSLQELKACCFTPFEHSCGGGAAWSMNCFVKGANTHQCRLTDRQFNPQEPDVSKN